MTTSNLNKFLLLMWKNWKLQWTRKRSTILTIIIPIFLSSLMILLRYLVYPVAITRPTIFPEVPINLEFIMNESNPNTPSPVQVWQIVYSPKNPLLDKIITAASETLKLEQFIGLPDSTDFEEYMQIQNHSLVGVQFGHNSYEINNFPKSISYSIRFPSELRMHSLEYVKFWDTQFLYPKFDFGGPRNVYYYYGGEPGYVREGFIAVQNAISMAIIKTLADTKSVDIDIPEINVQRVPYPPYNKDDFLRGVEAFIPLIIVLSYIHLGSETIKDISTEKEKQLKEVMKIMGLSNWLHWSAWFIKSFILMGISTTVIVILYKIKWNSDIDVAVFTHTDITCLLLFFYAYMIAAITYFFMITTFFSSARTASAVNGLIWFMFYIPYTLTNTKYKSLSLTEKLGMCLFQNTGLGYGLKLILQFEGTGEGLQWRNLFRPVNIDDNLSVGLVIIMMLVSSMLYMLITLYVEKINPGSFGVPEKWYFPFTKKFWFKNDKSKYNDNDDYESNNNNLDGFESYPTDKRIGVSIKNLNKKFGKKQAVKNLSINLYENEITVLLGHNGAGKTTTISMLTGMIPPTSGTAIINDSDIRTDLAGVRKSLGLCPQHNILFDELTVRDHIIFYSRVKGLKNDEIKNEVDKYIQILQLENKINTPAKNLSGGMKRKLSVICALCGNTKVVFLDEPSSGMDPAARRTLWDILRTEKQNRTILLSTHYMDEADAVSDRIAIMSASELKCYGTSFYLKKRFGAGYHLICVKNESCDPAQVTKLLKKYIPDIEIDKNVGTELSYKLPDSYSMVYEQMLGDLEDNSKGLSLEGYGISNTTLEEVFMEVGSEKHDVNQNSVNLDYTTLSDFQSVSDQYGNTANKRTSTGMIISQWKAMLLKKYLYSKRNYVIFLLQNFIVVFLIITTMFIEQSNERNSKLTPLKISVESYSETVNVIEATNNLSSLELKIAKEYEKYVESYGNNHKIININNNFTTFILEKDVVEVNLKYFAAVTFAADKIIAWFNNQLLHTAPLSLNIIHNAIIRTISPEYKIDVINYPLPKSIITEQAEVSEGTDDGFTIALNLCIGLSFATAFYVLFLIKERESRAKLLQFVSGVRVAVFWLSHFIFDYFIFIIITIVAIITLVSFQKDGYTTFDEIGRIFLVISCFGLAMLPFLYLISMLFNQPVTGYSYTSFFNIICVALFIVIHVMRFLGKEELADILNSIFLTFPMYALATALNNLNLITSMSSACIRKCKYIGLPDELCKLDILCKMDSNCCLSNYFTFKYPGIGWNLIYMILVCIICLTLLMLISLRFVKEIFHKGRMLIKPPSINHKFEDPNMDDDVKEENDRIANMSTEDIKSYNLMLTQATKYYSNFLAVNKVSLAINHSECFGLLGVNGAGKTTLFKMMTGDEIITYGEAYVKGKSLRNKMNEVYRDIGYCPQFDALLEDLTGREILRIFGLLRGIQESRLNELCDKMAVLFGYTKHIDKPCKTYSGGNKRKLSTSIAVLGCPSVIYLDEPTSGMDPGARRQLWNVVNDIRSSGKTIILTSHSMEECEALCTRLAIMVNGEFKCIGSTQHLKNKFARGLTLKIKAKREESIKTGPNIEVTNVGDNSDNVGKIKLFIDGVFSNSALEEEYQGMLTFSIPLTIIKWSQIFGMIERNKQILNIEDYSISQTTLEQIFLSFAEHQREDTRLNQ